MLNSLLIDIESHAPFHTAFAGGAQAAAAAAAAAGATQGVSQTGEGGEEAVLQRAAQRG